MKEKNVLQMLALVLLITVPLLAACAGGTTTPPAITTTIPLETVTITPPPEIMTITLPPETVMITPTTTTTTPPPTTTTTTPPPTTTTTPTPTPDLFEVQISGFAFMPLITTIPVGATVTWTNLDLQVRVVHSATGIFQSAILAPGDSFSYTFTEVGVFNYHLDVDTTICGPEPPAGKIIVE